ncbi:response regulator [Methylobacterium sp. J-088]|uniref:ATP-binding protein n=1 Tax=Methylobacterium sp. J-088 TaxID=2836664 RepID=UPI001FBA2430|nr:ATP-binding protein [Methylobacterium sp. J-088]MCJ2061318.1 response regulator [Methylobacterium sp. J-088]
MKITATKVLQELLRQQTALARFGELAIRSDDLDEILTEACRLAGEALGTDLAKVVELRADGKTLLVRAGVGWKSGVIGQATITAEHDTSEGHALRTGEPMISPDIAKETRFRYSQFLIDNDVRAVANVLILGGRGKPPFGILQIDSHVPRQFTESDTLFLRSYANLLAGAVDRIRVMGEVRDREASLRTILAERVAERTRELTDANARLHAEAEERGRIEEALRQSLKMEAVGQLTGGLAHDFNNLLAGISGSLEFIRIRIGQDRASEATRYIDVAMTSVDRAAALTHRLLAFSRRQTLDPKATDVNRLVGGMEDLFRRTVGPGIAIETRLADDLWPALCDPNQLENAMLNLVINARDAMPDGGPLTIETRNSVFAHSRSGGDPTLGSVPAGEYMGLFVTDGGTGMPPDVIARVFEPFFTTKPLGEGTGLGLSMIYGFVQQSGGHVLLGSETGQGTVVSIYLPRHLGLADGVKVVGVVPSLPRVEASTVVLVVEDETALRMLIVEALSELGYSVLEAEDGQAGLRIIETGVCISLLLTDVGLPGGMNGRQLADAARVHSPTLKVLFLTGYAASAAVRNGRMALGMELMNKPFALDALGAKVQEMTNDIWPH